MMPNVLPPRGNNELIYMTRRYPRLPQKVLRRDGIVANKLIRAWDERKDAKEVLSIFLKEKKNLSDERYWELMRTTWIIAGSVENASIFRDLMTSGRKEKYYFSTPEESKKLREMTEILQVYRAVNINDETTDNGLSWTLSKEYAEWYKQNYCKSTILSKQVHKNQIFAFIERNNESEIIIL